jgi:NTP pyrophosphatase (non-canonical NTP hydrolase)
MKNFQEIIRETYYGKDKKRGVARTFQWLVEEMGELSKALREGKRDFLEEEFADVVAWLASLANLVEISLEDVAMKRYGEGCPKCKKIPCQCVEPTWRYT